MFQTTNQLYMVRIWEFGTSRTSRAPPLQAETAAAVRRPGAGGRPRTDRWRPDRQTSGGEARGKNSRRKEPWDHGKECITGAGLQGPHSGLPCRLDSLPANSSGAPSDHMKTLGKWWLNGKIMGKPSENGDWMGKLWENHRKMVIEWENYGKKPKGKWWLNGELLILIDWWENLNEKTIGFPIQIMGRNPVSMFPHTNPLICPLIPLLLSC